MKKKLDGKFWAAMLIFGLIGQIAWVVENMYLNVFLYKMFNASAADISLMVGASSVAATLTTVLVGAFSDKVGKRKLLMCLGYIIWGVSILGFGLIKVETLTPIAGSVTAAASLGVSLVIALDCIMTFFGSAANDAAYNAWLTDMGSEGDRGKIEGFNSMMPLIAILFVFGGFMGFNLDLPESWTVIFNIIGGVVLVIGVLGFFMIEESEDLEPSKENYWKTVIYSFRPSVINENRLLYAVLGAFAVFGISIQTYMPYLILYYEKGLGMANYVLIMAPAIILAAVITALYGKVYDMAGFKTAVIPTLIMLMSGYAILFFGRATVPVFIGSLLMMSGYLTGMSVFGAKIRDHIPEERAGQFQGIRIIGQVLVPGIIGPAIGAWVLRDAEMILNNDGTYSFLPNENIFLAAFAVAAVLCFVLALIFRMVRLGHYELSTEAGEALDPKEENVWQEYPRPQMKRASWMSLNGIWKLEGKDIRVPFPPQSQLSNYGNKVKDVFTYERTFSVPEFKNGRVLLHFGAVDQIAEVSLNGKVLGTHEGGYLAFSYDITDSIKRVGDNVLKVKVTDKLSLDYPYGKQCKKRGGMWYTPVSGIWKSVWLEAVPEKYIERIKMTPDLKGVDIELFGNIEKFTAEVILENGQKVQKTFEGKCGRLELSGVTLRDGTVYEPTLWTCETPHLYEMTITVGEDRVETYFGLRTIDIHNIDGINRVCLNGEPIFLHGVLDQGYFPEGIYLPAEEKEYDRDILRMKELGINFLRKHIKVEPDYFYYACDNLGMLVMQDMVNSGPYSFVGDTALPTFGFKTRGDKNGTSGKRKEFFRAHVENTIEEVYNHPSIVAYTIFNEGWGQFHSDEMYEFVKTLDSTRLADSTSGWFAQEKNDFDSEHIYFKAIEVEPKERPMFLSECGGYSMAVEGHYYSKYNTYGYGGSDDSKKLTDDILSLYDIMVLPAAPKGMCGCIYTQLSDVEDEINGLYTYDRKVCKVDKERMLEMSKKLQEAVNA
ncbi:MAG: MFS transporter [Lachnospiraceae bacterium]|nr:MFS transporter [Lachnospiraceae bacterium]